MKEHEKEHYEFFDKEIQEKKHQTNEATSNLGFAWSNSWVWNCNVGKKSYNALYGLCRRGN